MRNKVMTSIFGFIGIASVFLIQSYAASNPEAEILWTRQQL